MRDLLLSILAVALGQLGLEKGMITIGGTSLLGMLRSPAAILQIPASRKDRADSAEIRNGRSLFLLIDI